MDSLLIKNAKLRNQDGYKCILVENGAITRIDDSIQAENIQTVDAGGNLVIPPFVDPHVHLDAVLSAGDLSRPNKSGTLLEAIDIWGERKPFLTKEILKENARETVKWYVANGVLRVRTHADCSDPTLVTVESLVELREEVKDIIDIQVVAFPQDGIFTKPDGEALLRRALEMGADIVGGAPHIEYTREDGVRDVETVYRLAEESTSSSTFISTRRGTPIPDLLRSWRRKTSTGDGREEPRQATPLPCTTITTTMPSNCSGS
jgi:cytosine deaminase